MGDKGYRGYRGYRGRREGREVLRVFGNTEISESGKFEPLTDIRYPKKIPKIPEIFVPNDCSFYTSHFAFKHHI